MTLPLRQLQVLRFIEAASNPVGVVDVRDHLGVALSTAHKHLRALRRKGLVEWPEYEHRGLKATASK